MTWLAALLGALALTLIFILYLVRKQLKSVTGQLRMLREEKHPNMIVRLDEAGPGFAELITEINALNEFSRSKTLGLEQQRRLLQVQISSISHDLRTPLTSVLGYLELAKEETDGARRAEYLDIVRRRAGILQTLIVDFYDLSCLEDPDKRIALEWLMPVPILEDTLLTFYEDFTARGIELELKIKGTSELWAGRAELVRVYTNLLQNILNYGGSRAVILHRELEGEIRTRFSNPIAQGHSFEPERLFERFYTGDQSRGGSGTGLGLYTVRLLLEKMGHSIEAELEGDVLHLTIIYGRRPARKS